MAKGGSDNILLWLALLGGALFYVYHRHETKEDNGTGPTKTPAAHAAPHPALVHHPTTAVNPQLLGQISHNPSLGGFGDTGCSTCPPAFSGFTYAPGDRVRSWFDADAHAGMYAVPMENSYGDVGSLF